MDHYVPMDDQEYNTIVISREKDRPVNGAEENGVLLMGWGPFLDGQVNFRIPSKYYTLVKNLRRRSNPVMHQLELNLKTLLSHPVLKKSSKTSDGGPAYRSNPLNNLLSCALAGTPRAAHAYFLQTKSTQSCKEEFPSIARLNSPELQKPCYIAIWHFNSLHE